MLIEQLRNEIDNLKEEGAQSQGSKLGPACTQQAESTDRCEAAFATGVERRDELDRYKTELLMASEAAGQARSKEEALRIEIAASLSS